MTIADFLEAWGVARLLKRRTLRRDDERLIRRRSDGSLWVAGCPQRFGYAMRGLFGRRWPSGSFHFYRVREWRGLHVASRRVFWTPDTVTEFSLLYVGTVFVLPPWDEATECAKIDAALLTAKAAA
jgi:hypothetical protein